MGCNQTSNGDKEESDETSIPYRLQGTQLPKADELFDNIENILSALEDIRSGLEDAKEEMLDIA